MTDSEVQERKAFLLQQARKVKEMEKERIGRMSETHQEKGGFKMKAKNEIVTALKELTSEEGAENVMALLRDVMAEMAEIERSKLMKERKAELLEKYSRREPTEFIQLDAPCDVDSDDYEYTVGETWELMPKAYVRILIKKGLSSDRALWFAVKLLVKYIYNEKDLEPF